MTEPSKPGEPLRPLWWNADVRPHGALEMIDQTRLPGETRTITCTTLDAVWQAIKRLQVRGAPAIGVAAAYGVVVGLNEFEPTDDVWPDRLRQACEYLAKSRPTAVNLFWALDRMRNRAKKLRNLTWLEARDVLLKEAHAIRDEDAAMCHAIGVTGQHVIQDGYGVITHCNAGALATSEYGTALAVIYTAHQQGRKFHVFVDETRPLLQGARLTAWELKLAGVDATLICDNMAAVIMAQRKAHVVITGADRIAVNGDAANKIGTYGLAVLAAAHNIPFYVAAPSSTFDATLKNGSAIPIEHRDADEVRSVLGQRITLEDMPCYNPAFDVTPAHLISGIVTEKGMIYPVDEQAIRAMLRK